MRCRLERTRRIDQQRSDRQQPACIEISGVDARTILVSFPTLSIDEDLSMTIAAGGILYVFDAARSS